MLKRKRDPTFTTTEKMSLIDLVERHFAIVECKKSDAVSMRNKSEEWQEIATEFNAISGIHPRLSTVLKNCWENLKKRAKQEQTLRNQHFLGTGGGPPKKDIDDPATNRVLELVKTRVSGFINPFDTDGTHILASDITGTTQAESTTSGNDTSQVENLVHTNNANSYESQVQQSEENSTSAETKPTSIVDWSQYTPKMLKGLKNPALCISPSPSDMQQSDVRELLTPSTSIPARTPKKPRLAASDSSASRRRPTFITTESLTEVKLKTLTKTSIMAEEEHQLKIEILHLQKEKEQELLKQEKVKTRLEECKLQIYELQLIKLKE